MANLHCRLTHSVKPMMRTDNRFVENINERCRPSNIAILYNNLESQEWVDAKESLEDAGFDDEVTITKFLCSVLMVSQFEPRHEISNNLVCVTSKAAV